MDDIYYVYFHVDPRSGEIVYIGKGCHGRAWDVTRNRTGNKEHITWCKQLSLDGYTPDDWVKINTKGLSEKRALSLEKNLLQSYIRPRFNRQSGERNYQSKLTDEQARQIYLATDLHKVLAEKYGVSRSAVSMIKSRKQWRSATSCLV